MSAAQRLAAVPILTWPEYLAEYERLLVGLGESREFIGIVDRAHLYHWFSRGEPPWRTAAGDFPSHAEELRLGRQS